MLVAVPKSESANGVSTICVSKWDQGRRDVRPRVPSAHADGTDFIRVFRCPISARVLCESRSKYVHFLEILS
jgi:hypothetical protein